MVIDWTEANARGERFVVYELNGATFDQALAVGSTPTSSFVHEGVVGSPEIFFYRVSAIDACGNESD